MSLTLLALLLPASADTPHPAALRISAPADLDVLEDWSRPLVVRVAFTIPAKYSNYVCQWWVDGVLRHEGPFSEDGACDATLDLSMLRPGRHKVAMVADAEHLDLSIAAAVSVLLNGAPQVAVAVEGTCKEDASTDPYVLLVTVDDPFLST